MSPWDVVGCSACGTPWLIERRQRREQAGDQGELERPWPVETTREGHGSDESERGDAVADEHTGGWP